MEVEMIPEDKLPLQLWIEIFSRLPVKVLVRLRCVSKTWRSLIDNPNFIHAHLCTFKNNSDKHFVLSWETRPTEMWEVHELLIRICTMGKFRHREEIINFRFSVRELHYDHKGYVNGLLLFAHHNVAQLSTNLIVFNPSIRKLVMLPPFPPSPPGRAEIVLGYDPLRNDHKVAVIFLPFRMPEDNYPDAIAIYEFSTGCWRIKSPIEVPDKWCLGPKVFAKGVMHWLCFDLSMVIQQRKMPKNHTHIVSFDFASETISYTELPGDRGDASCERITYPFVLGNSLALFEISGTRTCGWLLTKCEHSGTNSWSKWYDKASDSGIFEFFREHKYRVKNLLYCEKIRKFLLGVNGEMTSYDMENNKMKDLETCFSCHEMGFETCQCRYVLDPYVESLVFLKPLDDHSLTSHTAGGE